MNPSDALPDDAAAPAAPSGSARGSRFVTWSFWWFAATPLGLFAFDALAGLHMVPDDLLLALAVIAGITQAIAFFAAAVGGFLVVNPSGRRRWPTSLAAIGVFLLYLLITLSNAHM